MQRIGTKLRRIVGPALLAAAELVVAFALLAATAAFAQQCRKTGR